MDGITHLTIEASYLYLALTVTAEKSDSMMALTWKEYGKADAVREIDCCGPHLCSAGCAVIPPSFHSKSSLC